MTTQPDSLNITEGNDYKLSLTDKGGEDVRLYKISLPVEIFVIAEDENRAIGQAECILESVGIIAQPGEARDVDRIPFGIQGWSRHTF